MKKIKGIYNGYELNNGCKYRLAEIGSNKYKLGIFNSDTQKWEMSEPVFNRVKDYKEYLKKLEN